MACLILKVETNCSLSYQRKFDNIPTLQMSCTSEYEFTMVCVILYTISRRNNQFSSNQVVVIYISVGFAFIGIIIFLSNFFPSPRQHFSFTFYYGTPASYDTRYPKVWNKLPKYIPNGLLWSRHTFRCSYHNKTWKMKYYLHGWREKVKLEYAIMKFDWSVWGL